MRVKNLIRQFQLFISTKLLSAASLQKRLKSPLSLKKIQNNRNYQLYYQLYVELKKYRNVEISVDMKRLLLKDFGKGFCDEVFVFNNMNYRHFVYLKDENSLQKFHKLLV